MLLKDDALDKTKKVADEVIESVGKTIKEGIIPDEEYARTVEAFAQLILARAEID